MNEKLHFNCVREPFSNAISLRIAARDLNGKLSVADNMMFKPHSENSIAPALMALQPDQAQSLMDELWDCGVRPSDGTGSTGQLQATEKHAADMRTIAFKLLKIEG